MRQERPFAAENVLGLGCAIAWLAVAARACPALSQDQIASPNGAQTEHCPSPHRGLARRGRDQDRGAKRDSHRRVSPAARRHAKIRSPALGFVHVVGWPEDTARPGCGSRSGNFEPYDLPAREIDEAILPVWLFSDRRLLNERIAARTYLAAHIPAKDLSETKAQFAEDHPDVVDLGKPLEDWSDANE